MKNITKWTYSVLLLLLILTLPSCGLFQGTNTKPALDVDAQLRANFTELYTPTVALIQGSQLTPEQKATLLARIATFDDRDRRLHQEMVRYLSEIGKFSGEDWKTLYERTLQTVEDLKAKR